MPEEIHYGQSGSSTGDEPMLPHQAGITAEEPEIGGRTPAIVAAFLNIPDDFPTGSESDITAMMKVASYEQNMAAIGEEQQLAIVHKALHGVLSGSREQRQRVGAMSFTVLRKLSGGTSNPSIADAITTHIVTSPIPWRPIVQNDISTVNFAFEQATRFLDRNKEDPSASIAYARTVARVMEAVGRRAFGMRRISKPIAEAVERIAGEGLDLLLTGYENAEGKQMFLAPYIASYLDSFNRIDAALDVSSNLNRDTHILTDKRIDRLFAILNQSNFESEVDTRNVLEFLNSFGLDAKDTVRVKQTIDTIAEYIDYSLFDNSWDFGSEYEPNLLGVEEILRLGLEKGGEVRQYSREVLRQFMKDHPGMKTDVLQSVQAYYRAQRRLFEQFDRDWEAYEMDYWDSNGEGYSTDDNDGDSDFFEE